MFHTAVFYTSAGDPVAGKLDTNNLVLIVMEWQEKVLQVILKSQERSLLYYSMLETYRDGIEVGPNSSLMIMMAQPLTDVEIANLAAYLKDAVYQQPK